MGWVGLAIGFARRVTAGINRSETTINRGGGDNRTTDHFSAPGDDAFPLETDYVAVTSQPGSGRDSSVGYLDPINTPIALPGEKRVYGRDPATGAIVNQVYLQNDGSITINNGAGLFQMLPNGDVVINGVTISAAGLITTPTGVVSPSVLAASKELAGHTHLAGTPPNNTGPNN